MQYEIILATANRPSILEVSIPLFLAQTRPAARLIVVDASTNHDAIVRTVERLTKDAPFPVQVIRGPRGMTRQRNEGIRHAREAVLFFPDDDSLWASDVAERVMRIYERDAEGAIGGVCQEAADAPPRRLSPEEERARRASPWRRFKFWLARARYRQVKRLVAHPLHLCGEALMQRHTLPTWLGEVDAQPVSFQIGFLMTYRTEMMKRNPFNEDLHQPRCELEDFDQSFAVGRKKLLVRADGAMTYHHKFGGSRGNGLELGLGQFLNQCYIVCRHSPPGSAARAAIKPYTRVYLIEAILFRSYTSKHEWHKMRGLWRAYRSLDELIAAPVEELTQRYQVVFERELKRG